MRMKATMKYHCIPIRMANSKQSPDNTKTREEQLNFDTFLVELQSGSHLAKKQFVIKTCTYHVTHCMDTAYFYCSSIGH